MVVGLVAEEWADSELVVVAEVVKGSAEELMEVDFEEQLEVVVSYLSS